MPVLTRDGQRRGGRQAARPDRWRGICTASSFHVNRGNAAKACGQVRSAPAPRQRQPARQPFCSPVNVVISLQGAMTASSSVQTCPSPAPCGRAQELTQRSYRLQKCDFMAPNRPHCTEFVLRSPARKRKSPQRTLAWLSTSPPKLPAGFLQHVRIWSRLQCVPATQVDGWVGSIQQPAPAQPLSHIPHPLPACRAAALQHERCVCSTDRREDVTFANMHAKQPSDPDARTCELAARIYAAGRRHCGIPPQASKVSSAGPLTPADRAEQADRNPHCSFVRRLHAVSVPAFDRSFSHLLLSRLRRTARVSQRQSTEAPMSWQMPSSSPAAGTSRWGGQERSAVPTVGAQSALCGPTPPSCAAALPSAAAAAASGDDSRLLTCAH